MNQTEYEKQLQFLEALKRRRKRPPVVSMADLVEGQHRKGPKPRGFVKRFWEQTEKRGLNDCWLWKGGEFSTGYASISIANRHILAHHVSYIMHHGKRDPALIIMHTCDNPKCVNPNHLAQGSFKQNSRDAVQKGRMALGELNGMHKLRAQDVRWIRDAYASGKWLMRQLGEVFGVNVSNICKIINRKHWDHVKP